MIVSHIDETKIVTLPDGLYKNVKGQVLISPACGSDEYVLRLFHIAQGGYSANHEHDYPHYVYVVEGEGYVEVNHEKFPIKAGSYAFIPNNAQHQLVNTATDGQTLKFLCMVPVEGHKGFPE
ncbi:MAG TPA: cupin domain-containing protein [Candidatus Limiplasma sp.]|nr:cupin domain-containing protein [Candidatus Limiplasma sp.]